jgi:hypothetical protein
MTEDAYQLLRRIGLPAHIQADPSIKQTPVLTNLAFKNKIGLYYLATVQTSSSDPDRKSVV